MVLSTLSHYAKELAEPIKTFSYALADTSTYLPKAYGSRNADTGEYFCDATNLAVEKRGYTNFVDNYNAVVENDLRNGETIEELNRFVNEKNFDEVNQMAKCLYEKHGVDPDTVAKFSESAQDVLSYNMEKLYMISPDLVDTADVPFTGDPITALIMSGGVMGAMYGIAKLRGRFGNLFYNQKF